MIRNKICPYCGKEILFNGDGNHPLYKSHEHLIPNSIFSSKRGNGKADFFVHRKCNAEKSQMDEILGAISKIQSIDRATAVKAINKSLGTNNKKRFNEIFKNSKLNGNLRSAQLPFSASEILSYMNFLAKGLHYKKYRKRLNLEKQIVIFSYLDPKFISKHIDIKELEVRFPHENINSGECIILNYLRGEYYIFFNRTSGVYIQILKSNKKNFNKQNQSLSKFID